MIPTIRTSLVAWAVLVGFVPAALPSEEPSAPTADALTLKPGLAARYAPGVSATPNARPLCVRVDPSIAFDWSDGGPDDRLPQGPFSVTWEGKLLVDRDGVYRFSAIAKGPLDVWIDGRPVYSSAEKQRREPAALNYGHHRIRVQYSASPPDAQVRLVWSSEHFAPETVNAILGT